MTTRVLGIDPGDARVGVAVSDELRMLAHALETIDARKTDAVKRVAALVREKSAGEVVIGLPRNMDGTFGPAAEKTRVFAAALEKELGAGIPVHFQDERLTTVSAARALQDCGKSAKNQKKGGLIDRVAAQVILQSWLDSRQQQEGVL